MVAMGVLEAILAQLWAALGHLPAVTVPALAAATLLSLVLVRIYLDSSSRIELPRRAFSRCDDGLGRLRPMVSQTPPTSIKFMPLSTHRTNAPQLRTLVAGAVARPRS